MAGACILGDVGGDAPGLVAREQTGSRPSSRLILEIDVGERVADDEALGMLSNTEGGGKLHAS